MTQDIKAQVANLNQAFKNAGNIISSDLDVALMQCGAIVERDAKLNLTDEGHVDTGRLRASITSRLSREGLYHVVQAGTNVDYAADVELGTGPHHVPIDDIMAWARRKGFSSEEAHAIQQKIEEHGTRPYPYLHPALEANAGRISSKLTSVLRQAIARAGK